MLGVDKLGDSAVIIKFRIKTLPARQWLVGREFNRRLKNRFDDLGIEIPFPVYTVNLNPPAPADGKDSGDRKESPEATKEKK
jgi:small-conductance mechanosensitive channel